MGKLTLMIVAAAILGGATLTLGMNLMTGDSATGRAEGQASLLARQIAETGQSLALAAMVTETGFRHPNIAPRDYDGGSFTVADALSADSREITVTVEGRYGGAVHAIENTYTFDPMGYPGPIWLDVPYASSDLAPSARVSGANTPGDPPARYDSRKFDELGLASYNVSRPDNALRADFQASGSLFDTPAASQWAADGPLLEDLSRNNDIGSAEGLYQVALTAMGAGDVTFPGSKVVSGAETWGASDGVTRVQGDLTVRGRLRGSGVLLVEGAVDVLSSASLDWHGIVIVRADRQLLPIRLNGDADISGGLVVVQEALPPGGHLDLTVARDPSGMSGSAGRRPSPNWPTQSPVDYPWWEHTHRFDLTPEGAPRGNRVVFAQNGAGPQEDVTQFLSAVQALGSEPVQIEFRNPSQHGFARYTLGVDGQPAMTGGVRSGFGSFAAPGNAFRSRAFPANDLRTLTLDVQSLRALKDLFDGEGSCDGGSWPFCVGRNWDRGGALSVRLLRASNGAVLYDAALYWHMKDDERAQHEAEEAAWRASLAAGTSFGTRLEMGPQASVTYSLADIVRLTEKLGFDGNEVRLVSSVSEGVSAAELRAAVAAGTAPATPPPTTPPTTPPATPPTTPPTAPPTTPPPAYNPPASWTPTFWVCHPKGGGEFEEKRINSKKEYEKHVTGHQDPIRVGGECPDD